MILGVDMQGDRIGLVAAADAPPFRLYARETLDAERAAATVADAFRQHAPRIVASPDAAAWLARALEGAPVETPRSWPGDLAGRLTSADLAQLCTDEERAAARVVLGAMGPVYVALDPGSRRLGAVAGQWAKPDLRILGARKIAVDPDNVRAAAAEAVAFVRAQGAAGVVIERGALYMPAGVTPQAAKSIADAHAGMSKLADAIAEAVAALGLRVRTVARASWVHRVIPHHRGGITDAMVATALPRHLRGGVELLTSKDLRDAAGALLWALLPVPVRNVRAKPRDPSKPERVPWWAQWGTTLPPEARTLAAKVAHERRLRAAAHARERGRAPDATPAAYFARILAPCPCGPHPRGRRPLTCPNASPSRADPLDVLLGLVTPPEPDNVG